MKLGDIPPADRAKLIAAASAAGMALIRDQEARISESGLSLHAQAAIHEGLASVASSMLTSMVVIMTLGHEQVLASQLLNELAVSTIKGVFEMAASIVAPYTAKERA